MRGALVILGLLVTSRVAFAQEAGGLGPTYAEPEATPTPLRWSAPRPRPEPAVPSPPPPPRDSDGLGVRAIASGGASRLLGLSFTGWSGAVGLGGQVSNGAEVYLDASYGQAQTANGLGLHESTLELTVASLLRPVHLGGGAGFVYMQIPRISEETFITRGGVGVHGWLSVDLVRPSRRQAFFVALRPEADWVVPQLLLRVTLGIGYRF